MSASKGMNMINQNFTRRGFCTAIMATTAVISSPTQAFAKTINRFSLSAEGFALKGFDTTAYLQDGAPTNGTDASTVQWKGATWRFATQSDADLFRADPDAYAPQFGGYCTRAMSINREVPGDPEVWRIYNGKLYVFFAPRGGALFDGHEDEMIALAQAHWDTLTLTE